MGGDVKGKHRKVEGEGRNKGIGKSKQTEREGKRDLGRGDRQGG